MCYVTIKTKTADKGGGFVKSIIIVLAMLVLASATSGCTMAVNLTTQQEQTDYAVTEVITEKEETNFVQQLDLTQREEFYLNAFAKGNRNNAVFEITTEDYTDFQVKTYKFEDGQWKYTNNFFDGKIKDKLTLLAVEYYYLPDINIAYNSGSLGGNFHDDADEVDYSYTSHKSIRNRFEISEEETAFIAYRRTKSGGGTKVAKTTDFANPSAVTDADKTDEYYMITISFSNQQ